ncbi:hypothetical protein DLM86_29320, partial [Paenibacillus flagellatus]
RPGGAPEGASAPPRQAAQPPAASPAEPGAARAPAAASASAGEAERGAAAQARPEAPAASAPGKGGDHWIARLFKAVGLDNEHQLSRAIEKAEPKAPHAAAGIDLASLLAADDPERAGASPADVKSHPAADSLKSVLLQLSASDAVPEPLREQAQQALQHVTGQQLLLSPDRTAMLTHVTMFLPVRHEGGEETAAVHVQARKGKRGEIDAQNCRLLFDLNMRTLGMTLVDVQVFDRQVFLQVHNDRPYVGPLLERYREEIEEGLRVNGYQFVSLKCAPFPARTDAEGGAAHEAGEGALPARQASAYRVKPYKGVDVRI